MELNINIHETISGDLFVKELAYEEGAYASSEDYQYDGSSVTFEGSASVTVLQRITTGDTELVKGYIHDHSTTDVSNKFIITYDGWYRVTEYVIPNESWLEWATENTLLDNYDMIYIAKGDKLYKLSGGELVEIELLELVSDTNLDTSNVFMAAKDVFVLYNLWQCYLNYCKKLFESECATDDKCSSCDDEMTKNRNLIWILLNTLQYLVRFGDLQEAQEMLENISGCNTLCSNEMFSKDYDCNCGK